MRDALVDLDAVLEAEGRRRAQFRIVAGGAAVAARR